MEYSSLDSVWDHSYQDMRLVLVVEAKARLVQINLIRVKSISICTSDSLLGRIICKENISRYPYR